MAILQCRRANRLIATYKANKLAKAKLIGTKFDELSMQQVRELHSLVNLEDVRCAFMETHAGHVDPSGITFAYAKGAKQLGAEIHAQVVVNVAGL